MQNKHDRNSLHCFYLILSQDDANVEDGEREAPDVRLPVLDFFSSVSSPASSRVALQYPAFDVAHSLPQPAIWQDIHGRHSKKEGMRSQRRKERERERRGRDPTSHIRVDGTLEE